MISVNLYFLPHVSFCVSEVRGGVLAQPLHALTVFGDK